MNSIEVQGLPPRKAFLLPTPIKTDVSYECLTSYIQRCANNHFVSAVSLIEAWSHYSDTSMLNTFAGYAYGGGLQSYRINGKTELTEWLSKVLVKQDLLIKVNQMTIPKSDGYKAIELRKHLAWCPICLQEQASSDHNIHYPLLWMPKNYTYCQKHDVPLLDQCPTCHQYQPVMAFHNHPGRCAHCFSYLGLTTSEYPYGFQKELWRQRLNERLMQTVNRKRYASILD